MSNNLSKKLVLRIRELRLARNIKQSDFADKLDMERSNFTKIESGKHRPNDENLEKISQVLGVEIKDLFDFEHKSTPEDLLRQINLKLKNNPEKIEDIYKIVTALTK